ncbi:sodium-coupled neutral amino acid transporter [Acrasis kona]|uniref:Sodium-coupled neutral amino acid transporter n=1 Tax=Acrasis kona TaxID=1008807 RepID=A0AAW2YZZ8_9EUKA
MQNKDIELSDNTDVRYDISVQVDDNSQPDNTETNNDVFIPAANDVDDDTYIPDDEVIDEDAPVPEKKGNTFGMLFNLVNTTVGAGILALPYAFKEMGIVMGLLSLLLMGVLAAATLHFLSEASQIRRKYSYKALALDIFQTKWAGIAFESTVVIVGAGAMMSYTIIIGQLSSSLMTVFLKLVQAPQNVIDVLGNTILLTFIIMLVIVFPLCCLRHIQFLGYTSLLSILSALFVVVAIVIRCAQKGISGQLPGQISLVGSFSSILAAFPVVAFSLTSHVTLLPMIEQMRSPTVKKVSAVGAASVLVCISMYLSMAVSGYVLFAENTQDNILNSFDPSDTLIVFAKLCVLVVVILSYPLFLYSTRECSETVFFAERPFTWLRWIATAAIICMTTFVVSIIFPKINMVLGLSGATGSTLAASVFPSIFYFKISTKRANKIIAAVIGTFTGLTGIVSTIVITIDIIKSLT